MRKTSEASLRAEALRASHLAIWQAVLWRGEDEAETTLMKDLLESARMLSRFSKALYVFDNVVFWLLVPELHVASLRFGHHFLGKVFIIKLQVQMMDLKPDGQ